MKLIDHQRGTIKLAISTPHDEIVRNTRALAHTAVAAHMKPVLTSSQEDHFQGLLLDDVQQIARDACASRIKRPSVVDCWAYEPFKRAVLALAAVGKVHGLQTVLTASFADGPNRPLMPEQVAMHPETPNISRPGGGNAWEDRRSRPRYERPSGEN